MVAPPKKRNRNHADPVFSVTELYEKMMRPTVSSKKLRQTMSAYRDVLRRDVDNDTLEAARPDNNLQVRFFSTVTKGRPAFVFIVIPMSLDS